MKPVFTPKQRREFFAAHGHKCDKCGYSGPILHTHHSQYTEYPDQLLCRTCHIAEHDRLFRETGKRSPTRPATEPKPLLLRRIPISLHRQLKAAANAAGTGLEAYIMQLIIDDVADKPAKLPPA